MKSSLERFVRAIIFDAEGVVVDTEPVWDLAQAEFLAKRGRVYDRERLKPLLTGRTVDESSQTLKEIFSLGEPVIELSQERLALMRAKLNQNVEFVPGFLTFYNKVAGEYRLAMATSLSSDLLLLIDEKLHISALFDGAIAHPALVNGRGKPAPDVFEFAADLLKIPCDQCVAVEDSPAGIRAALAASMYVVALTSTHPANLLLEADQVVEDFSDLDLTSLDRAALVKAGSRLR